MVVRILYFSDASNLLTPLKPTRQCSVNVRGEKGKNRRCRNKTSDPSGICNVHRPAPEPAPPAPPADPPPIYDPDDDLYGLSPTGEQSLAKIRAVKESQQEPATAQPSLSQSPSPYRQRDEEPDLPEHPTVSPSHGVPPPKPNIDSDIMASPRSGSSLRDAEMWDVLADSEREEEEGSSAPPADPTQATEPAPAAPATPAGPWASAADPAESAAPPTVRTPYLSL